MNRIQELVDEISRLKEKKYIRDLGPPNVSIAWTQGRPAWNDGEPCEFYPTNFYFFNEPIDFDFLMEEYGDAEDMASAHMNFATDFPQNLEFHRDKYNIPEEVYAFINNTKLIENKLEEWFGNAWVVWDHNRGRAYRLQDYDPY